MELITVTLIFLLGSSLVNCHQRESDELILLHVVHRHGARVRDDPTYPNDPYYNETYWPYGLGQLTNLGKQQEYQIGKSLRSRYGSFLGDIYYPELLDARSTDVNRTKMSIELSLAGLFPPEECTTWNERIPWQPIPYNYEKAENDHVIGSPTSSCPKVNTLANEYLNGDAVSLYENDYELYQYVTKYSGYNVTSPYGAALVYYVLLTQDLLGYTLPSWVELIWEDPLRTAAAKMFQIFTGTPELARLGGGFFVKKVLDDTYRKIDGTLTPLNRKLFLYSAHDITIAYILSALNIYDNKIPNFASYVVIEVRLIDGVYGVKIFYQNYEKEDPILLTIPGCESFCPLDKFAELVADVIPESEEECNL